MGNRSNLIASIWRFTLLCEYSFDLYLFPPAFTPTITLPLSQETHLTKWFQGKSVHNIKFQVRRMLLNMYRPLGPLLCIFSGQVSEFKSFLVMLAVSLHFFPAIPPTA